MVDLRSGGPWERWAVTICSQEWIGPRHTAQKIRQRSVCKAVTQTQSQCVCCIGNQHTFSEIGSTSNSQQLGSHQSVQQVTFFIYRSIPSRPWAEEPPNARGSKGLSATVELFKLHLPYAAYIIKSTIRKYCHRLKQQQPLGSNSARTCGESKAFTR